MLMARSAPEDRVPTQRDYQATLARQLAMNKKTWEQLVAHGYKPDQDVQLDFFYAAPNRDRAVALKNFLNQETDYHVEVTSTGSLLRKSWQVTGTTQKTKISPEILDQWVQWMVAAGQDHACLFDGWGTSV
jgi:hypothetical protein